MNSSSLNSSTILGSDQLSSARKGGLKSDRFSVNSSLDSQRTATSIKKGAAMKAAANKQQASQTQKEVEIIDPLTGEKRNVLPLSNINPKVAKQRQRNAGGGGGGGGTSSIIVDSTSSGQVSPSARSDTMSHQSFSMSESLSRAESSSVFSDSSGPSVTGSEMDDFSFSGQPMSLDDSRSVSSSQDQQSDAAFSDIGDGIREEETDDETDFLDDASKKQAAGTATTENEDEDPYCGLSKESYDDLMERDFTITLSETQTIFLFENYDRAVASTAEHLKQVQERNRRYQELRQRKRENPDRFASSSTQTLNKFFKNKYTNTENKELSDQSIGVTGYDIFDEYRRVYEEEEREREEREQISSAVQTEEEEDEETEEQLADMADEGDEGSSSVGRLGSEDEKLRTIFKKTIFKDALMTMERMVVHNRFREAQEEYKRVQKVNLNVRRSAAAASSSPKRSSSPHDDDDYNDDEEVKSKSETNQSNSNGEDDDEDASSLPIGSMQTLWNYSCAQSQNISVNCMSWNHVNKDILAAGYSNLSLTENKESLIMCWTVKNPLFPERIIRVPNLAVTSIDFSKTHPSLLSIGCSDGTICIYDVRKRENEPVLESASKHHTGTVWSMQWVEQGKDVGERLRSVGVDGRVNAWSIKKGLECQEIMRLKRTSRQGINGSGTGAGADGSGGGGIADAAVMLRESGGMCIDTDPSEPNFYIVGTEDGPIHKCSGSYNEQYLETYYGHTGPVYQVKYDPFDVSRFASCSADWTIRLWDQEQSGASGAIKTIEVFRATADPQAKKQSSAVNDIAWSKTVPSLIASATVNGRIDLWDVSNSGSTVRPRFRAMREGNMHNCIVFAPNSHALLAGDISGNIEVLKPNFDE